MRSAHDGHVRHYRLRSTTDDTSLLPCSCEGSRRPAPPTVPLFRLNQVSTNEMDVLCRLFEKVSRSIDDDELIQLMILLGHRDSYLKDMAVQVYSYMHVYMLSDVEIACQAL